MNAVVRPKTKKSPKNGYRKKRRPKAIFGCGGIVRAKKAVRARTQSSQRYKLGAQERAPLSCRINSQCMAEKRARAFGHKRIARVIDALRQTLPPPPTSSSPFLISCRLPPAAECRRRGACARLCSLCVYSRNGTSANVDDDFKRACFGHEHSSADVCARARF